MILQITIIKIQENMEMRYTRHRAIALVRGIYRGMPITLTFLTRAVLSSSAEAVAAVARMRACSISTTTMAIATATIRSVRSWSHFDTTKNSKEEFEAKVSNLLIKSNQLLVLIRFARKKRNILQMSLYVLHR